MTRTHSKRKRGSEIFTEGDWVVAKNLKGQYAERNGQLGHVTRVNRRLNAAWRVVFEDKAFLWLYKEELELASPSALQAKAAQGHDAVHRPAHYTGFSNNAEPIDIAENLNYNRGCALKYIVRAGKKGDEIQDLQKALFYINRELTRIGGIQ
ncbi:DUF3310 domain-containing protein [Streptomyces abikoensis]|uniref:DUF3310 domain-containing protein n=1 Tax=Streptomyces abikoensis TaxID=97398 RepID=UPI0036BF19EC